MEFENSEYAKRLAYKKEVFDFGVLYTTEHFVISEINEGIHVDHSIAAEIIDRFYKPLKDVKKLGYIANRYNSYSFDPKLWIDFNNAYDFLVATAIVTYSEYSYKNATLEKRFFSKSLKRCRSLDEAIEWMLNLKEFRS